MNAAKTTTTRRAPDAPDCTPEDAAAYSAFYDKHYRIHIGLIHHLYQNLSREETEDIVATTYMLLWRNWPTLRGQPDKAISAWVDTTASRRAIDLWRRHKMALSHEYSRAELHAISNSTRRSQHGTHHSESADLLALITEYVATHDAATDPERWAMAREELAHVLQRVRATRDERSYQAFLAWAMGYTQVEIARVQGRTDIAVKHDLIRSREGIGAKEPTYATTRQARYTVTIRKGEAA